MASKVRRLSMAREDSSKEHSARKRKTSPRPYRRQSSHHVLVLGDKAVGKSGENICRNET